MYTANDDPLYVLAHPQALRALGDDCTHNNTVTTRGKEKGAKPAYQRYKAEQAVHCSYRKID